MGQWKKVESEGSEVWDFTETPELEGTFVSKEEKVGPNNSNLYRFKVGASEVAVWGNTVLDSRLVNLNENDKVKIVYLGKKPSKRGGEYKDFDVFHWEEELPF